MLVLMLLLGVRTRAVFLLDCPPGRASTKKSEASLEPSSMEATPDDDFIFFDVCSKIKCKDRKARLTILISLANKITLMSSFILI